MLRPDKEQFLRDKTLKAIDECGINKSFIAFNILKHSHVQSFYKWLRGEGYSLKDKEIQALETYLDKFNVY